ncbi:hypothetical protein MBANPS3_009096, partial [Mucor bainieri]
MSKRPLSSSSHTPGFPSKRASRLSVGMDSLNLNADAAFGTPAAPTMEESSSASTYQTADASTSSVP